MIESTDKARKFGLGDRVTHPSSADSARALWITPNPTYGFPDLTKLHAVGKTPRPTPPHIRLVFVGTAASQRSADAGHYDAHPGNRFWRTIHEVSITPRRYAPHEFPELLKLGIGLTDLCKLGADMDHQALAFPIDIPALLWAKRPPSCSS